MTKCTVLVHAYANDAVRNDCLPRTGADVLPWVLVGVLLLVVGLGLWWATRDDRAVE